MGGGRNLHIGKGEFGENREESKENQIRVWENSVRIRKISVRISWILGRVRGELGGIKVESGKIWEELGENLGENQGRTRGYEARNLWKLWENRGKQERSFRNVWRPGGPVPPASLLCLSEANVSLQLQHRHSLRLGPARKMSVTKMHTLHWFF